MRARNTSGPAVRPRKGSSGGGSLEKASRNGKKGCWVEVLMWFWWKEVRAGRLEEEEGLDIFGLFLKEDSCLKGL